MKTVRTYSELCKLETLEDRFAYLKCPGVPCETTLGSRRYLCQQFYRSKEWRSLRDKVISRDEACELGLKGFDISGTVYIHHIEPLTAQDFETNSPRLFDMENLICVSYPMHQAIHYQDSCPQQYNIIERRPNDTSPWKVS